MTANNIMGICKDGNLPRQLWVCTYCEAITLDFDNLDLLFCLGGEQSPHPKTKCIRFRQPNKPLFASAEEYCASTLAKQDIE